MGGRAGGVLPGPARQFFQGLTARLAKAVRIVTANELAKQATDWAELRIPRAAEHIWEWFWELDQGRRCGNGPEAIGYADIMAWARLSGEEPRPWEVRLLMTMDVARRAEYGRLSDPASAGQVSGGDTKRLLAMMRGLHGRAR